MPGMNKNIAPYVQSIIGCYVMASPDDVRDGLSWYPRALNIARSLDPEEPHRAAGVIAALSPLTSWPLNLRRAREVYQTGTTSGLGHSVRSAARIYKGEDPLAVLTGPKVLAFYLNITGRENVVTIDRHAIDIACGRAQTDPQRGAFSRGKERDAIEKAYHEAAKIIGERNGMQITGPQVQAVTWTYWRRERARANHGAG